LIPAVSMVASSWFFLYTPVPYLVAIYLAAYRHDLFRVARPVRDIAGRKEWWSVCTYLGLVSANVREPKRRLWKSPLFWTALVCLSISVSWAVVRVPLAWYYLCLIQAIAALPPFILLARTIGPVPFRPYRDVLPFPRLGTRIRHLKGPKRTDANSIETPVNSGAPGAKPAATP
jgi:hypothetical protein